ncbi:MAG: DUF1848 domain-containing protein [Calditrichaeota bacterium]|nr:DUF1848 domain-containing protein [Calditrichota bacterium]
MKAVASNLPRVISASRRLDMVAGYPDELVETLASRCPPETTHTVVIWTKDPRNLLRHERLRATLARYDQLFLHLTITGLGATELEPRVPPPEDVLALLPELIRLVGHPARLRIRFDPIVHIRTLEGLEICNLPYFERLAPVAAELGLHDVTTSWMTIYPKVVRRLERAGFQPRAISRDEWRREADWMLAVAKRYGIRVHGCCVEGWPRSRCIDGFLLTQLHPKGLQASTRKAKGQRSCCGCTESWDIGWYKKCPLGCRYCYANPVEHPPGAGRRPFPDEFVSEVGSRKERRDRSAPGGLVG